MVDVPLWDMILKLVAAGLLGGLIGLERETHGRPAGLRTHILVSLGSALFALGSYAIAGHSNDPGRITAQIVTGIGFLGAGTIMHQGNVVRGLTTAASIWTVAAIGIAVAIGGQMFFLAIVATVLVVATLNLVPQVERYLQLRRDERLLQVVICRKAEAVGGILGLLEKHHVHFRAMTTEEGHDPTIQIIRIRLHVPHAFDESALGSELITSEDVISYSWE